MIIFTRHAKEMLLQRNIPAKLVRQTIKNPDHCLKGRENKTIYLKYFGKNFLKVIVSEEEQTVVITAHWWSKERFKKEDYEN